MTFSLSNMGCQAVKSHEKSTKHVRIITASTNQPSPASVITAFSSDARHVTPLFQFAV